MTLRIPIFVAACLAFTAILRTAELDSAQSPETQSSETFRQLDQLFKAGRFQEFTAASLAVADQDHHGPALSRLRVEALLATGDCAAAEQTALRHMMAADAPDPSLLGLWLTARWRQGGHLDDPQIARLLDQPGAQATPLFGALEFSRRALDGANSYRAG